MCLLCASYIHVLIHAAYFLARRLYEISKKKVVSSCVITFERKVERIVKFRS